MSSRSTIILILLVFLAFTATSAAPNRIFTRCEEYKPFLVDFFVLSGGPHSWRHTDGWRDSSTVPVKEWFGVSCFTDGSLEISLPNNGVIVSFSALEALLGYTSIDDGNFVGGIQHLNLADNIADADSDETSAITDIIAFPAAIYSIFNTPPGSYIPTVVVDLSGNGLGGVIPSFSLADHQNHFLSQLSTTFHLDVSRNQISGSIPASIGVLLPSSFFNFSHNQLSGTVPGPDECKYRLETKGVNCVFSSEQLSLFDSKFHGMRPSQIDFSYNQLSGLIPGTFFGLTYFALVDLSNNALTGFSSVFRPNAKGIRILLQNNAMWLNPFSRAVPNSRDTLFVADHFSNVIQLLNISNITMHDIHDACSQQLSTDDRRCMLIREQELSRPNLGVLSLPPQFCCFSSDPVGTTGGSCVNPMFVSLDVSYNRLIPDTDYDSQIPRECFVFVPRLYAHHTNFSDAIPADIIFAPTNASSRRVVDLSHNEASSWNAKGAPIVTVSDVAASFAVDVDMVDVSHNQLFELPENLGAASFDALRPTKDIKWRIGKLDLSNNFLNSWTMAGGAPYLCRVEDIDISNNPMLSFDISSFSSFFTPCPCGSSSSSSSSGATCSAKFVNISNTQTQGQLFSIFASNPTSLEGIDASYNSLTNTGPAGPIPPNFSYLSLKGNVMSSSNLDLRGLAEAISNGSRPMLDLLDIRGTSIGAVNTGGVQVAKQFLYDTNTTLLANVSTCPRSTTGSTNVHVLSTSLNFFSRSTESQTLVATRNGSPNSTPTWHMKRNSSKKMNSCSFHGNIVFYETTQQNKVISVICPDLQTAVLSAFKPCLPAELPNNEQYETVVLVDDVTLVFMSTLSDNVTFTSLRSPTATPFCSITPDGEMFSLAFTQHSASSEVVVTFSILHKFPNPHRSNNATLAPYHAACDQHPTTTMKIPSLTINGSGALLSLQGNRTFWSCLAESSAMTPFLLSNNTKLHFNGGNLAFQSGVKGTPLFSRFSRSTCSTTPSIHTEVALMPFSIFIHPMKWYTVRNETTKKLVQFDVVFYCIPHTNTSWTFGSNWSSVVSGEVLHTFSATTSPTVPVSFLGTTMMHFASQMATVIEEDRLQTLSILSAGTNPGGLFLSRDKGGFPAFVVMDDGGRSPSKYEQRVPFPPGERCATTPTGTILKATSTQNTIVFESNSPSNGNCIVGPDPTLSFISDEKGFWGDDNTLYCNDNNDVFPTAYDAASGFHLRAFLEKTSYSASSSLLLSTTLEVGAVAPAYYCPPLQFSSSTCQFFTSTTSFRPRNDLQGSPPMNIIHSSQIVENAKLLVLELDAGTALISFTPSDPSKDNRSTMILRLVGKPEEIVHTTGAVEILGNAILNAETVLGPWFVALRGELLSAPWGVEVETEKVESTIVRDQVNASSRYIIKMLTFLTADEVHEAKPMAPLIGRVTMCALTLDAVAFQLNMTPSEGHLTFSNLGGGMPTPTNNVTIPYSGTNFEYFSSAQAELELFFSASSQFSYGLNQPEFSASFNYAESLQVDSLLSSVPSQVVLTVSVDGVERTTLIFSEGMCQELGSEKHRTIVEGNYCFSDTTDKWEQWRLILQADKSIMVYLHHGTSPTVVSKPLETVSFQRPAQNSNQPSLQIVLDHDEDHIYNSGALASAYITAIPGEYVAFHNYNWNDQGRPASFTPELCAAETCPVLHPTPHTSAEEFLSVEWERCGVAETVWSRGFSRVDRVIDLNSDLTQPVAAPTTTRSSSSRRIVSLDISCVPVCSPKDTRNCSAIAGQVAETAACYIGRGELPSSSAFIDGMHNHPLCGRSLAADIDVLLRSDISVRSVCAEDATAWLIFNGTNTTMFHGDPNKCSNGLTVRCSPCLYYFAPKVTATPYVFVLAAVVKNLLLLVTPLAFIRRRFGDNIGRRLSAVYAKMVVPITGGTELQTAVREQVYFSVSCPTSTKENIVADLDRLIEVAVDTIMDVGCSHTGTVSPKDEQQEQELDAIHKLQTRIRKEHLLEVYWRVVTKHGQRRVRLFSPFVHPSADEHCHNGMDRENARAALRFLAHGCDHTRDDETSRRRTLEQQVAFVPTTLDLLMLFNDVTLTPPTIVLWLQFLYTFALFWYLVVDIANKHYSATTVGFDGFKRFLILYHRFFNTPSCFLFFLNALWRYVVEFRELNKAPSETGDRLELNTKRNVVSCRRSLFPPSPPIVCVRSFWPCQGPAKKKATQVHQEFDEDGKEVALLGNEDDRGMVRKSKSSSTGSTCSQPTTPELSVNRMLDNQTPTPIGTISNREHCWSNDDDGLVDAAREEHNDPAQERGDDATRPSTSPSSSTSVLIDVAVNREVTINNDEDVDGDNCASPLTDCCEERSPRIDGPSRSPPESVDGGGLEDEAMEMMSETQQKGDAPSSQPRTELLLTIVPSRFFVWSGALLILPALPNLLFGAVIYLPVVLGWFAVVALLTLVGRKAHIHLLNNVADDEPSKRRWWCLVIVVALSRVLITTALIICLQSCFNYSCIILDAMSPSRSSAFASSFSTPSDANTHTTASTFGSMGHRIFVGHSWTGWADTIRWEYTSRSLSCAVSMLQQGYGTMMVGNV